MASTARIKPLARLYLFLAEDKQDLLLLLVYTTISSLLGLSIPLAAQALINTIASGLFLQPLVIITILVLLGLSFNGLIRALEVYLVEILQRRIFARIALRLSRHIPNTRLDAFGSHYPPELVNRFFDTVTTQKIIAKLFLDVPSALLQGSLAFIFMGLYSPFLLAFEALIVISIFLIYLLGGNAVKTSIKESSYKYDVAHWLEELARCQLNFKVNAHHRFSLIESNRKVVQYLEARKKHFKIVFRQRIAGFIFYTFANVGVLGLGGWLVLEGQLTLGQLVAAELMTLIMLTAAEKILASLESFYDLQTSMDKLGILFDLPEEASGKTPYRSVVQDGAYVELHNVRFGYSSSKQVFDDLDLSIPAKSKISIIGRSGSGKTTLGNLIAGLYLPDYGTISVNGLDLRTIDLISYRDHFSLVSHANDLFEGTLEANIRMNRPQITQDDLDWALSLTELNEELPRLDRGLDTRLISEGKNLSEGLRQRVILARALVERPSLIVIDEGFSGIDETRKVRILDRLMHPSAPWTLIHMTHDLDVICRSESVYVMEQGTIQEKGDPWTLADNPNSLFSQNFPKSAMLLRRTPADMLNGPLDDTGGPSNGR